jgi:rod shape-determining protein MreD
MFSLRHIFSLIGLLLLQVFILNNINLLEYINPYVYIAFVFFYPLNKNRFPFLILCFLLGLSIDFFSDSGGIHAASILLIAYLRLFFIKTYFKKLPADFPFFKLETEPFGTVLLYLSTLTLIHHFIFFFLANFSFQNSVTVVINTFSSALFTLLLVLLGSFIFRKKI